MKDRKLGVAEPDAVLTGSGEAGGCRGLHGLPSVVPVLGEAVDNGALCCLLLPLFPAEHKATRVSRRPCVMDGTRKSAVHPSPRLPLQPLFGLLPLGHLRPAVVVVFLSGGADVLRPVVAGLVGLG